MAHSRLGVVQMQVTTQLDSVWQRVREDSRDGEILRRRAAALGAVALGLAGFLIAIGLSVVVLGFVAAIVVALGIAAFLAVWPKLPGFGLNRVIPRGRRVHRAARAAFVAGRARTAIRARTSLQKVQGATSQLAQRATRRDPIRDALHLNTLGTQHR